MFEAPQEESSAWVLKLKIYWGVSGQATFLLPEVGPYDGLVIVARVRFAKTAGTGHAEGSLRVLLTNIYLCSAGAW
jgi:hypothetical protein